MTTELVGRRLGDFEVIRELGRGGMGVVFEARQVSLNRSVALKVLDPGLGLTPTAVARFRREAEAAAKLHHTNIVPVYAIGEQDGVHFYAMELIDGHSLHTVIRQLRDSHPSPQPASPPGLTATGDYVPNSTPTPAGSGSGIASPSAERYERAALMIADVADALHHAHLNGVTHRDIKPANLLLSAEGRLSVTDFGLARILEQPGMTVTGEFVGTPAYMSPEQVTAGRVPVDHRTDIYSLGATLYELLTLRPPFTADGRDRLLALVTQKEPPSPRWVNPKVPRDLETICLKCLEKDPDRRYQTAKELADDLRRYVNRFAIRAKRVGALGRLKKWAKRNPGLTATAAAMVAALASAGAFAWWAYDADRERTARARHDAEILRATQADAALEKALLLALSGDLGGAERAIGEAELLGASVGDVRTIRGQIAYCRGESSVAIEHLEVAMKLIPERVGPRALLAAACMDFGAGERFYQLLTGLDAFALVTAEDYLFKGLALSYENPAQGLAAMDEGIRRRDSSVARALRGRARANAAVNSGSPADAAPALEDIRVAKAMMPNNPFAFAQSVWVNLIAAGAYAQHGQEEKRQEALAQARRDLQELERSRHLPVASVARIWYLRETDDHAAALAEARSRQASGVPLSVYDEMFLATGLYHDGKFDEALAVFDRIVAGGRETTQFEIVRCYVLAELPDGPARALAAYRSIRVDPTTTVYAIYAPTILHLLGQDPEAVAAHRAVRVQFLKAPTRSDWVDRLLEFNADLIPEDKLLAAAGESRLNRCEAHFFIGMTRLGKRDRAGAVAHFRRCVDTHVFTFVDHIWSRAFLARLENDPNWPPGIKNPKK